jgi:hypothetical protein
MTGNKVLSRIFKPKGGQVRECRMLYYEHFHKIYIGINFFSFVFWVMLEHYVIIGIITSSHILTDLSLTTALIFLMKCYIIQLLAKKI